MRCFAVAMAVWVCAVVGMPQMVRSQCAGVWLQPSEAGPGVGTTVMSAAVADSGAGAQTPIVTVNRATDNLGTYWSLWFDGRGWKRVYDTPALSFNGIAALTAFDPDGAGPAARVVVASAYVSGTNVPTGYAVVRWTGSGWTPLGSERFSGSVNCFASVDVDGRGPQLYAGGSFTKYGNQACVGVARWDGATWQQVGTGVSQGTTTWVQTMTAWDSDGDGPAHEALVVAGQFSQAGRLPLTNIAMWDGSRWARVGALTNLQLGVSSSSHVTLVSWDSDGAGPLSPRLLLIGDVSGYTVETGSIRQMLAFDGVRWTQLASTFDRSPHCAMSWDPDGDGPQPPLLVVGGDFNFVVSFDPEPLRGLAVWDGKRWSTVGGAMHVNLPGFIPLYSDFVQVNALTAWRGVGGGEQLFAAGWFPFVDEASLKGIGAWDGQRWTAFARGPAGIDYGEGYFYDYLKLGQWTTPRGESKIVVTDGLIGVDGQAAAGAALWDGDSWTGLPRERAAASASVNNGALDDGAGPRGASSTTITSSSTAASSYIPIVRVSASCRVDGDASASLFLAGDNVFCWDGHVQRLVGGGLDGFVQQMVAFNPDPLGRGASELIAGGRMPDLSSSGSMRRWNGHVWASLGDGLRMNDGTPGVFGAMTVWDMPGLGPQLVVSGTFDRAGGVPAAGLARWDGAAWHAMAPSVTSIGSIVRLTTWNPSGSGPSGRVLVAATARSVWRWSGSQWVRMGPLQGATPLVFDKDILDLASWDPDGPGPLAERLVVAGSFQLFGTVRNDGVAVWNGTTWVGIGLQNTSNELGLITPGSALSLMGWTPSGRTPQATQLIVVAGHSNEFRSSYTLFRYSLPACPCGLADITGDPSGQSPPDGLMTVDDFVVFLNAFSSGDGCEAPVSGGACSIADVASADGAGADGQLTIEDLLGFLSAFGEGCGR